MVRRHVNTKAPSASRGSLFLFQDVLRYLAVSFATVAKLTGAAAHSARASSSCATKAGSGGFPMFALGETMYFAASPNSRSSLSDIFRKRSRNRPLERAPSPAARLNPALLSDGSARGASR
jgi:hypothetical protein